MKKLLLVFCLLVLAGCEEDRGPVVKYGGDHYGYTIEMVEFRNPSLFSTFRKLTIIKTGTTHCYETGSHSSSRTIPCSLYDELKALKVK